MKKSVNYLEKIYKYLPGFVNNIFITGYNFIAYKKRYSGYYNYYRNIFKNNENLSFQELKDIQFKKLMDLLNYAKKKSKFYRELYKEIDFNNFTSVKDLEKLPVINKEMLRQNIDDIVTIDKSEAVISKTGGTTGKSLVVYNRKEDIQLGFAFLDNFRSKYGYTLGKKTAWFSGKNIISERDIRKNIFWKTDYLYKVRYYSTFHIQQKNLKYYINDLIKFKPLYLVGFPSSINEIASYGLRNNINFPSGIVKAVFPTAETFTQEFRINIESFFKTKAYDQYASSEGAPFIFECTKGNMHLELQSGVFEVLDEQNKPAMQGRLVVTSFRNYGTPLIRYDIGDEVILSDEFCDCGNNNPTIKKVLGRKNDFIYSFETGKITLVNISNCLKGVHGVIKFQIIQDSMEEILIKIVKDDIYNQQDEKKFIDNLRDRVGKKMKIELVYVDDIENEVSGKYRLIKNSLPVYVYEKAHTYAQ